MDVPSHARMHELEESIVSIECNGDVKNPLLSVLVENDATIKVYSREGELKSVLEGHATPVRVAAWCSPDMLVSISTDGELRQWTFRGSKQECLKSKFMVDKAISIVPLPPMTKNAPPRCAVLHAGGEISVVEPSKGVVQRGTFKGCIGMQPRARGGGFHLVIQEGGSVRHVEVDGSLKEALPPLSHDIVQPPVKVQFVTMEGNASGITFIDETGKLFSWYFSENKMHVLEDSLKVTAAFLDQQTSTLFLGTKEGTVRSHPLRKNLSAGDALLACDAHDFQVTAVYANPGVLVLASGSMDGILKFHGITRQAFQTVKVDGKKEGMDWREAERIENKLNVARDMVARRQFERAGEVLAELQALAATPYKDEIHRINADLNDAISKRESESEKYQKLLSYLERVARDRGDILLDEICKDLKFSKPELVRIIKVLDDEMDWEFVERYECLFLFKRERAITSMPVLEHHHADRHERKPRDRGDYHDRRPRRTLLGQERQHPAPGAHQASARPVPSRSGIPGSVIKAIDTVKGRMVAAFLDRNGTVVKQVAVPDLVQEMETFKGKLAYVITDGIISPRLVDQSAKLDVAGIIGRRVHPNVDPRESKTMVIEFEDVPALPANERGQGTNVQKPDDGRNIEDAIVSVLGFDRWTPVDGIMVALDISDAVEQQVIKIKLKQLVTTRVIDSETHEGKQYFKRIKERNQ